MRASLFPYLLVQLSTIGWVWGARINIASVEAESSSAARIEANSSDARIEANSSDTGPEFNIEYGYAPNGNEPTFVQAQNRLFAFTQNTDFRVQLGGGQVSVDMVASHDAQHHSRSVSASMGIQGSYGAGGNAFEAAIAASTRSSGSSSVRTVRVDGLIRARMKTVRCIISPSLLGRKLAPGVANDFNRMSPEQIYHTYGAFRATRIDLGGVLRTTVLRELRESDEASQVEASVRANMNTWTMRVAASGSASTSTAATHSSGATHSSIFAQGGEVSMWFGVTASSSMSTIQRQWARTVADNLAVTRFSLEPLSNVIRLVNTAKAVAFERHCRQKWGREAREVARDQGLLRYAATESVPLGIAVTITCPASARRIYAQSSEKCNPGCDLMHGVGASNAWGSQDQKWIIERIGNSYTIKNQQNGRRLYALSGGDMENRRGAIHGGIIYSDQTWNFQPQDNGLWIIANGWNGRVLYAQRGTRQGRYDRGFGAANDGHGYEDQKWRIERA